MQDGLKACVNDIFRYRLYLSSLVLHLESMYRELCSKSEYPFSFQLLVTVLYL
jgi:hypothetical protein